MTGILLRAAKNTILLAAAATGVDKAIRNSAWRRRRLLILCYHGLSLADEHEWSDLYVTADHLQDRLNLLLRTGYHILPLDEGVRRLYDGTLPSRSVAITFDDGFADFYLKGHPILCDLSVPSVLYLTTYYATKQLPVFNPLLSYLLWKGQGRTLALPGALDGAVEIPRSPSRRATIHAHLLAHARQVGWSAEEKDAIANDISAQIRFDIGELRARRSFYLMSAAELADLDPNVVDIQLHTHRHRTPRDEDQFVRELIDNREAIRRLVPERRIPTHFCYPSGDYDVAFLPWLRREGVVSATTCEAGIAGHYHDPLLLPRFLDSMETPRFLFESWLAGTASFLPRRPR